MADEEKEVVEGTAEQGKSAKDKENSGAEKPTAVGIWRWIIPAVVVVACACAGLGLGRLFAGAGETKTNESLQDNVQTQVKDLKTEVESKTARKTWYYDLEPVIANLDVPGVTRYVRATLTLEIRDEVDIKKGTILLEREKPLLTSWLTIYLASLTLEDTRGDRNLKRIQLQIRDAFNEKLFPDSKPQIIEVLFKEFAVQ
jgi:flagellar basal body-associated protein FliL